MSVATPSRSGATRCPACGCSTEDASPAWEFHNVRGQTEWQRCGRCHSYFMDDQYTLEDEVEHAEHMSYGDTVIGEKLNEYKRKMYHAVLDQLTCHINPQGKTLLDVGCSYGGFMQTAQQYGFTVSGLDIVPQAIDHCRSNGLNAQCCGQVGDFSLTSEPFDVISVLDMHMYWPNQPEELSSIFDRLKPGGLVVMRVVSKSWLATVGCALQKVSASQGQKVLRRAVNDHRFSMPLPSFLALMKNTGFEILVATSSGAVHSEHTSFLVRMSFAMGTALQKTLGILLTPGAVVIARRPA